MAQENANVLHAAIRLINIPNSQPQAYRLIAATGVEVAGVRFRTDLAVGPYVIEVPLVVPIDDSELFISYAGGPVGYGPVAPPPHISIVSNPDVTNIIRDPYDLTKKIFYLFFPSGIQEVAFAWWRIPPIEPIDLVLPPQV